MLRRFMLLGAAWAGAAALVGAAILPWMKIPIGAEGGGIIAASPIAARYFRIACVLVAGICVMLRVIRGRWCGAVRRMTAAWLVVLLSFPFFTIVWDPILSAESAWLQMQHENLTWLGGDICTGAEYADTFLKTPVYPVDPPRRLTVFRIPASPPWQMELAHLGDLLEWLGYTEAFCQFAAKGWFVAIFGTVGLLTVACVGQRDQQRIRIIQSIRLMAPLALFGAVVAWALPFAAGWQVARAEEQVRLGQYHQAIQSLEAAARTIPVLQHDTSFVAQMGKLRYLLGETTPEAKLYAATRLEAEGRQAEAHAIFREVSVESPPGSPVRREACRAILRSAIHALNSGRSEAAEEALLEVLAAEPTNLKANYTLQLASLRSGKRDQLEALVTQLYEEYRYFQTPTKEAVLAAAQSNRIAATLDEGDSSTARRAYRKFLRP